MSDFFYVQDVTITSPTLTCAACGVPFSLEWDGYGETAYAVLCQTITGAHAITHTDCQ